MARSWSREPITTLSERITTPDGLSCHTGTLLILSAFKCFPLDLNLHLTSCMGLTQRRGP